MVPKSSQFHLLSRKPAYATFLLVGLVLAACTAETLPAGRSQSSPEPQQENQQAVPAEQALPLPPGGLPDMGMAPEIENDIWLNSDGPLTLGSLRGKVVLIEFWTFG